MEDKGLIFEISALSIYYRFRRAVENLSFSLAKGKSLGLLGANGAGKTSTICALLGMVRPRQGKITLFGGPTGKPHVFRRIGFAPEDGIPPEYLTGEEYLRWVGTLRTHNTRLAAVEARELVEWFELHWKKKVKHYSKGMKKRLVLAQAFVGSPEFLILDEPLNGLDPIIILKLREKLATYLKCGGTLLYSSHILSEVEKTCSDVLILDHGKLVCQATVENLCQEYGSVERAFAVKVETRGISDVASP